jgi:hypothetical protein
MTPLNDIYHISMLVAKDYTQIDRIDYKETFKLVTKINIIRILLSIAINKKNLTPNGHKKYILSRHT